MAGISGLFEIGKRALLTYKAALDVVGHNVANVDTPGYSRQEAVLEAVSSPGAALRVPVSGVRIAEVRRSYSKFLDFQINRKTEYLGKWKATKEALEQVELIFNESSGQGLSSVMGEFWAAWQEVANNPEGMPERLNLRHQSEALIDVFNRTASDLERVQSYAADGVLVTISEINSLASRIAGLNDGVVAIEIGGQKANDLRDKRAQLLQQLADRVEISYFEASDGSVSVYVAGGRMLVEGNQAAGLQGVKGPGDLQLVNWVGLDGEQLEVTDKLSRGTLGGWLDVRDSIIPGYRTRLDALASSLIKEVNKVHSNGVGLAPFTTLTGQEAVDDSGVPLASASSGLPFYSEISDGSFEVWVYDDTGALAASSTVGVGTSTSLVGLQGTLDSIMGISASITGDGRLKIDASTGWSFHVSNDTSGLLMALGLNTMFTGSSSSDIALNDAILGDLNRIAAASVTDSASIAAGNNLNALSMIQLQDSPVMENGTMSMSSYYRALVASIGIDAAGAEDNIEYQEALLNQLDNRRQMVSGVSLDEEMIDLMEYSHAYNAAARLLTTAREMLDVLLQLTD